MRISAKEEGMETMCKCVKVRLKPVRARWWKDWEGKKVYMDNICR